MKNFNHYNKLIDSIVSVLDKSKQKAYTQVNTILIKTYWEIGRYIIEFEQAGKIKAEYGAKLIDNISKDLKQKQGKGFSRSNLIYMRLFYIKYPQYQKGEALPNFLTWTHFFGLLKIGLV
ncbi:MAG: DUF1016 domain-containing protein [Bacteroidetes bacterium]|nr:DUF1016 domain-containing protein [Bacteroidota bacterium]